MTIVEHLLRSGADVNLLSCKGESVADVTEDDKILKLLEESESSHYIYSVGGLIHFILTHRISGDII